MKFIPFDDHFNNTKNDLVRWQHKILIRAYIINIHVK